MSRFAAVMRRAVAKVPAGVTLSRHEWEQRHHWIAGLLWLHVPFVIIFALARGFAPVHALLETTPIALLAFAATSKAHPGGKQTRSILAGLGLMVSSAVLVHLSGGTTEMHFHFFVMLGVISLYQDWRPFLVSIGFVAGHHAIMGSLRPADVFHNEAALRNPLLWALIHALFVLAACAVSVISWQIVEDGHRRSRKALEESESRFRALIENSTDVVTVVDAEGVVIYDSPSCAHVLGYNPGDRVGRPGFDYIHPDDMVSARGTLEQIVHAAAKTTVGPIELRVRHRDGSYRWVELSVTNLLDEPGVRGIVTNFRDVTERRQLENQLSHQAFHDPLTGLANRALLLDRLEHALASTRRRIGTHRLALVYVDLDDFKTVNDGLGHEAGDELLKVVALRIVGALRPGDTAARLGGDEFAILLEELPTPGVAYDVGARLLEALRDPFDVAGNKLAVNASLGIAVSMGDDDAASLLRNADLAMYRAKGEGKGRFEVYEAGMHAAVVERMALKADLRRAIDADEFEPHYQPIVDLMSSQVTGIEALARWNHPERGLVVPLSFIPMAEETGLIIEIGRVILDRACMDMAGWREEFGDAAPETISINLSARQIQHPDLVADVTGALRRSGLPASALTLEVTESILLEDGDAAARTLASLKQLGVSIALDDFGTGYSSLAYLNRFPVDVVKIDKSFIDSLAGNVQEGSPLVTAIINLGTLLGLDVTAEGIEDVDQVARLRQLGCVHGQGYYFARPMPASELGARLAKRLSAPAPLERV
jgi:diguanylate cyclase (GGDEF)-like protein/PAS domain S-box-containing protein